MIMSSWADIAKAFVVGTVTIGLATALFLPGRTTTSAAGVAFNGANRLFATAVTGKAA
jgi:hypothetical protein